jgi:hypothetical protein
LAIPAGKSDYDYGDTLAQVSQQHPLLIHRQKALADAHYRSTMIEMKVTAALARGFFYQIGGDHDYLVSHVPTRT